jgi:ATP-dependent DNA ligase
VAAICGRAHGNCVRRCERTCCAAPRPTSPHPGLIEQCLPTNGRTVATGPEWAYEIKHDGFRFVWGARSRPFLLSTMPRLDRPGVTYRRRTDGAPVTSITLDGEGTVCGPDGASGFDLLRAGVGRKGRAGSPVRLQSARLDDYDLRREPLEARRDALASLLHNSAQRSNLHRGILLFERLDGADGDSVF